MFDGLSRQHLSDCLMLDEPKHYYLLTPHEAEMLACFRMMDEQAQAATSYLMAAQAMGRQDVAEPVRLSLVNKD